MRTTTMTQVTRNKHDESRAADLKNQIFFWTPQPLRRCECRPVLAYNPASDQSYGLCERYPQRTSRDNHRRACAGFLVSCSGHEWVESNWTGWRRGRARRKYSFAAILDSSPGALRVVLCGQPARKQAPENILVLDSDAHGFLIQSRDCGFDHLPDCVCRTSLRPVIPANQARRRSIVTCPVSVKISGGWGQ